LEIQLPEVFNKFSSDFPKKNEELTAWLFQFFEDNKKIQILHVMDSKSFSISYLPYNWAPETRDRSLVKHANCFSKLGTLKITRKISTERTIAYLKKTSESFLDKPVKNSSLEKKPESISRRNSISYEAPLEETLIEPVFSGFNEDTQRKRSSSSADCLPKNSILVPNFTPEIILKVIIKTSKQIRKKLGEFEKYCIDDKPIIFENPSIISNVISYCIQQIDTNEPLESFQPNLKETNIVEDQLKQMKISLLEKSKRICDTLKQRETDWKIFPLESLIKVGKILRNIKNALKYING